MIRLPLTLFGRISTDILGDNPGSPHFDAAFRGNPALYGVNTMSKHEMTEWEFAFISEFRKITSEPQTVSKRDGATCDYTFTDLPPNIAAVFPFEGYAEYLRDSSSAALANAFILANPRNEDTGKVLVAARNAWQIDNVPAVAIESSALMADARDRANKGERRIKRESVAAFTPLQEAIYDAVGVVKGLDGWEPITAAFDAAKGATTPERKALVLAAVDVMPDITKTAIIDSANAAIAARSGLAGLANPMAS